MRLFRMYMRKGINSILRYAISIGGALMKQRQFLSSFGCADGKESKLEASKPFGRYERLMREKQSRQLSR